ncbi:MAG: tRNA (guanosine(37)-N1)-methyltransferase TrmD [Rickettsiales bacterium]|jgi:tRNA (guanine37-N1)-methyltransferase|nr:tRNA (guanosine(37)-N1)-methyltransferase TrmD [Rickettsiales bacterium]
MKNTCFNATILTLFPEDFPGILGSSIPGIGLKKGVWNLKVVNIRDFAEDKRKTVDDTPCGGGAGMVLKPDVVGKAIESLSKEERENMFYLSPRGQVLNHKKVKELKSLTHLTLICGHYEGLDERVLEYYNIKELSIGDYVLSGGEVAALVVLDTIVRQLDCVLGDKNSLLEESFENEGMLEYPQYTRPVDWKGLKVPEVLLSGNHKNIEMWKKEKSMEITKKNRPELLKK